MSTPNMAIGNFPHHYCSAKTFDTQTIICLQVKKHNSIAYFGLIL